MDFISNTRNYLSKEEKKIADSNKAWIKKKFKKKKKAHPWNTGRNVVDLKKSINLNDDML